MQEYIKKSAIYAALFALVLGIANVAISLFLDWKSRSRNPELYDKLIQTGTMDSVFSWGRILLYTLEIFVAVFLIFSIYYYFKNRKTT
ncbi:hypothetical protein CMO92_01705 [Candidatus Woesearchaeota archaeon]|nr:hypothetical protein [Candidatus Woesearchaeota archaeon]|tara:strand:+ start:331 stop:594 length:264 start_codon:yes stop_codon:yes gene_type:complete